MSTTLSAPPSSLSESSTTKTVLYPPAPTSIEETGLPTELLVQLLVKCLFSAGELTEASAGEQIKLPYAVLKELFGLVVVSQASHARARGCLTCGLAYFASPLQEDRTS